MSPQADPPSSELEPEQATIDEGSLPSAVQKSDGAVKSKPTTKRRSFWWVVLFFVLIIGAAAGYFRGPLTGWLVAQGFIDPDQQLISLGERLATLEQKVTGVQAEQRATASLAAAVDQQRQRLDELSAKQVVANQQVTKIQAALAQQLADWRPIEVRHLLFLADQRLHIAGDVRGAIMALRSADVILQGIEERRWLPLREKIAAAVSALQVISRVDIYGIRFRLRELASRVDELSGFAQLTSQQMLEAAGAVKKHVENDQAAHSWQQRFVAAWEQIKTQLADLVKVRRSGQVLPALTSEQLQGVKFHLTGELLLAEVDLLQGDPDYNQRLYSMEQLIGRYFDPATQPAVAILQELDALQAMSVVVEVPDISPPLLWLDQELTRRSLP